MYMLTMDMIQRGSNIIFKPLIQNISRTLDDSVANGVLCACLESANNRWTKSINYIIFNRSLTLMRVSLVFAECFQVFNLFVINVVSQRVKDEDEGSNWRRFIDIYDECMDVWYVYESSLVRRVTFLYIRCKNHIRRLRLWTRWYGFHLLSCIFCHRGISEISWLRRTFMCYPSFLIKIY